MSHQSSRRSRSRSALPHAQLQAAAMPAAESAKPEGLELPAKRRKRHASAGNTVPEQRMLTNKGDHSSKAQIAATSKLSVPDRECTLGQRKDSQPSVERGECTRQLGRTTFLAFLRGVNVGSHNRLPMAELRTLLSGLGYENVKTHLQSGNAIFTAPANTTSEEIAESIQSQIKTELDLTVVVVVRTKSDLADIVLQNPLETEAKKDGSRFLVLFLSDHVDLSQQTLDEGQCLLEHVAFGHREVYVWCPNGVAAAKHGPGFWEKQLGVAGTARNWNTVTKLLEMAGS